MSIPRELLGMDEAARRDLGLSLTHTQNARTCMNPQCVAMRAELEAKGGGAVLALAVVVICSSRAESSRDLRRGHDDRRRDGPVALRLLAMNLKGVA